MGTLFSDKGILFSKITEGFAVNGGSKKPEKLSIEETVRQWNLLENMLAFLQRGTVFSIELPYGYSLKVMVSDAPYSDHNFMVAMVHEKDYINTDNNKAAIVHEAPNEISEIYWRCCLQLMGYFYKNSNEFGIDEFFVIENTCSEVSGKMRIPRSIKAIHAQVGAFARNTLAEVEPEKLYQDGLTDERDLWKSIGPNFVKSINAHCPHQFELNTNNFPQGYNLSFEIDPNCNLDTYAVKVNDVLREHHAAYASAVNEFTQNIDNARPQPSYVTYITVRNGNLVITISPVIVSYAGGLDAAGIITARTPDAPSRYSSIEERREEARKMLPEILEEQ